MESKYQRGPVIKESLREYDEDMDTDKRNRKNNQADP